MTIASNKKKFSIDVLDGMSPTPLFQYVGHYFRDDNAASNMVFQFVKNGSSRNDFGTDFDRFNINLSGLANVFWGQRSARGCLARAETAFHASKLTSFNAVCLSVKFMFNQFY